MIHVSIRDAHRNPCSQVCVYNREVSASRQGYENFCAQLGIPDLIVTSFSGGGKGKHIRGFRLESFEQQPKETIALHKRVCSAVEKLFPGQLYTFSSKTLQYLGAKNKHKKRPKQYGDSFSFSNIIDTGVRRKFKRAWTRIRTKAHRIFVSRVRAAANHRTFFTDVTDGRFPFAANHIWDYGKVPVRQSMDPNNGFLDFSYVGDLVEDGILSVDGQNRVVIADGFDPEQFELITGIQVGSVRPVTPGQVPYWARHYNTVFNKRKAA